MYIYICQPNNPLFLQPRWFLGEKIAIFIFYLLTHCCRMLPTVHQLCLTALDKARLHFILIEIYE